ncbi:MAG: IPT/TIG domain-containing protein [Nitrospirales bacterium]
MSQRRTRPTPSAWIGLGTLAVLLTFLFGIPGVDAKSKKARSSSTAPPKSVASAPVCNIQAHPKISAVKPDSVKPGQKIVITGTNFGTEKCFRGVSFGPQKITSYKFVNGTTLEATVPNIKSGLVKVGIQTEGGTSDYVLLVEQGKSTPTKKATKKSSTKKRKAVKKKR